MKPELTNELKARFFAQYWGQTIGVSDAIMEESVSGISIDQKTIEDIDSLELKPLSVITDEDAIEVPRIIFGESDKFAIEFSAGGITSVSPFGLPCYSDTVDIHWNGDLNYERADSSDYLAAYQYLQSKGYALPFMGYSVEELVQAGWIKLTA